MGLQELVWTKIIFVALGYGSIVNKIGADDYVDFKRSVRSQSGSYKKGVWQNIVSENVASWGPQLEVSLGWNPNF